ncbi:interleukin-12 subunit alpha [Hoplias malabaricus]|uniref:interleukin-12 subunit alpha n=1 Tax=Hoplias malabaricus TaxID=27720 RepID=UPI00346180EE
MPFTLRRNDYSVGTSWKQLNVVYCFALSGTTLCLVMTALLCAGALANPLRASAPQGTSTDHCTKHAKSLLDTLKKSVLDTALEKDSISNTLFHGFNCTELPAEVTPNSQTVTACQPTQDGTCSGQSSSSFSEPECLKNIRGDLQYYLIMLGDYVETLNRDQKSQAIAVVNSISESIRTLQTECPLLQETVTRPKMSWGGDPFDDRMNLCKHLKGFHVRAITINRALGYISAGEYKK